MASDEELARRVARAEEGATTGGVDGAAVREELAEYRTVAGEIHDELARRIEVVDDRSVEESTLEAVVDRLDRLETRLDDIENRL